MGEGGCAQTEVGRGAMQAGSQQELQEAWGTPCLRHLYPAQDAGFGFLLS